MHITYVMQSIYYTKIIKKDSNQTLNWTVCNKLFFITISLPTTTFTHTLRERMKIISMIV